MSRCPAWAFNAPATLCAGRRQAGSGFLGKKRKIASLAVWAGVTAIFQEKRGRAGGAPPKPYPSLGHQGSVIAEQAARIHRDYNAASGLAALVSNTVELIVNITVPS